MYCERLSNFQPTKDFLNSLALQQRNLEKGLKLLTKNGLSSPLSQILSFTFRCITTVTSSNLKCIAARKEKQQKKKLRGDIDMKI